MKTREEENVESLKARATELLSQLRSLPPHRLTISALSRLSKLIHSELRFLQTHPAPPLSSTNLGYLEAVVQVLWHPDVDAVSAVLHTFRVASSLNEAQEAKKNDERAVEAHVDIVCTFQAKPVWIIISDRNPKYICWSDECNHLKGWRSRVQLLVDVAQSLCVLRPSAVLFCFARGVPSSVLAGFERDVGALQVHLFEERARDYVDARETPCIEHEGSLIERDDGDWVCIYTSSHCASLHGWVTCQVGISAPSVESQAFKCGVLDSKELEERPVLEDLLLQGVTSLDMNINGQEGTSTMWDRQHVDRLDHPLENVHSASGACSDSFLSCLLMLGQHVRLSGKDQAHLLSSNLVNLDTTALIALVSEISNGAALTLFNMSNEDLVSKFKSTAQFMKDQAEEELKGPLLKEMTNILKCRRPFMSAMVCKEFKSLVSLCGSVKEKTRAEELLKVIPVVPDSPSARVMNLSETGKIKDKNKVIFGTGDFWQAPTLTANFSFVRAIRQTGMALSILEHKPRALVGDKCG